MSQRLASILRQVAAVAALVLAAIPQDQIPNLVRPWLVVAGAVVLGVEHYVADPSTGSPPKGP